MRYIGLSTAVSSSSVFDKKDNTIIKKSLIYNIDLQSALISCNFDPITILIHLWNFLSYFSYLY
jgi:hypothetical protein